MVSARTDSVGLVAMVIVLVGLCLNAQAQTLKIKKAHLTSGGQIISSASYQSTVLAGQSFIGRTESPSVRMHVGFFPNSFNQPPTDIIVDGTSSPENNLIGDVVLTLSSADPEVFDSHTYALVPGTGDTDNSLFTIAGNTLQSNTFFDFETKSNYSVRLQTDDGDFGRYEEAFTITITDNNDAPDSIMVDNLYIGENALVNTLLDTLKSRDQDATNTHIYSLVPGNGDIDNAMFKISNDTLLLSNTSFDFEANATHSIRIRTTDNDGGTYDSAMVVQVVDENDFPTDIMPATTDVFSRPENEEKGTPVLNLTTSDVDAIDSHTYSLVDGVGSTHNAYFDISGSQVIVLDTLNFERDDVDVINTFYELRVQTTDAIGATYSEAFKIEVTDINDAPNDITLGVSTIKNTKQIGDAIGTFIALDEDLNSFNEGDSHTFSLQNGVENNDFFNVESSTGKLTSNRDFSTNTVGDIVKLKVAVRDSFDEPKEKIFEFEIVAANSGNVAPLWIEAVTPQIQDHNLAGSPFLQVEAQDDAGDTHTYNLVSGIGDSHNMYFSGFQDDWLIANTSFDVKGDSIFSVRIEATDQGDLSKVDIVTFVVIPFVDNEDPEISNVQVEPLFDYNTTVTITAEVTDNTELETVEIFYKGISEDDSKYLSQSATGDDGFTYSFDMAPATHGAMGLEVYISATDTAGNDFTSTPTQKAYIQFNAGTDSIPSQYLGFGGKKTDWKIFSIPYDLEEKDFKKIFGGVFGAYDKINWRLVHWSDDGTGNGSYIDFEDNAAKADLGQGYWFNALERKNIVLGAGKVNMQDSTKLILTPGFNQIGNPYNIPISWESVLENNDNPLENGTLQIFSESGGQADGDVIQPFSGGFVFVAGGTTEIYVNPVTSKADVGGRIKNNLPTSDLGNDTWLVEMSVSGDNVQQVVGSFGIHPEASVEKDHFDRLAVPRFQAYTEIYSKHEEYSYPWFRRDIINSRNEYTWDFTYESNTIEGLASFIWNPDGFGDGFETLKLYNKENGELIDMRAQSSYQIYGTKALKFSIFFSRDPNSVFVPDELLLGDAYPNPTDGNTVFPIVLPESRDHYNLEINIYNLQGKLRETIAKGIYEAGIHEFQFDFNSSQTPKGIYIYQLRFNDGFHVPVQKKIFIKK